MKFKHHYNKTEFPDPGERNIKPSLTIPGQAMGLKQMIERHRNGLPVRGYADMQYIDDIDALDGRDIRSLDLEEVKQISLALKKRYEDARDKWYKEETQRREQERDRLVLEKYKKENPHLFKEQSPAQPE